ncbi:replication initiation protein [Escherichia coli]
MREKAYLLGKYKDYRDFRQKLLQPSIDRINAATDISVIWEPVKTGRSVTAIRFAYVDESTPEVVKPVRPRLPRRPHVTAGSAAEGEWARKCIQVLTNYRNSLLDYDDQAKLTVPDLRKLAGWYKTIGHSALEKSALKEISLRTRRVKT